MTAASMVSIDRAVGLVYAPGLDELVRARGLVDVVAIEPEMFWCRRDGAAALHRPAWERVRALPRPKVVHGVGRAVGGTVAPDAAELALFARCAADLDAAWASHHLAFNWFGAPARFAGFFLPPRQTDDGVRAAAAAIRAVARAVDRPFAVETPVSYLAPRADELPDGEFVARVCAAADCGLLLDLHNVWTNARNGRQPVEAYLAALPLERVIEVHVAGGFAMDGVWLDAHSGAPPDELLDLMDFVVPRLPAARAVTFEITAPFVPSVGLSAIGATLERIRRAWSRPRAPAWSRAAPVADPPAGPDARAWEDALGALAIGRPPSPSPSSSSSLADELAADRGVALLRTLVAQGRAGMITDALRLTTRVLVVALGGDGTFALLEAFWRATPPAPFAADEADAFAAWLGARALPIPHLADALALDLAAGRAQSTGDPIDVDVAIDPRSLVDALARGVLPAAADARVIATVTPG